MIVLNSEPTPELVLSLVATVILSFFIVSIGHRFVETITDRATEAHLGGGFLSGAYLGYDVDPDTMVIEELVNLTTFIGSSSLSLILTSLSVLSVIEILFGQLYIWDKREKVGVLGSGMVMCSGYLFPNITEAAIILFLFGALFYVSSEKSDFHR